MEVPEFAEAVLYKAFVGVAHILRQVAEEDELGVGCGELGDVFDLDPFALDRGWRVLLFDDGQEGVVELGGGDAAAAGLVDGAGGLEDFEDALLVDDRGEDDGHVVEGRYALADEVLVVAVGVGVFLDEVPLVDDDDDALVVALDEREDVEVLLFEALAGVEHEDADVGGLDGAHGAHDGVELEVFADLALAAQTGGVDEVEVEAEEVVT